LIFDGFESLRKTMSQRNASVRNRELPQDGSPQERPKNITAVSEMNQSGAKFLLLGFALPLVVILLLTWLRLPELLSAWIARLW